MTHVNTTLIGPAGTPGIANPSRIDRPGPARRRRLPRWLIGGVAALSLLITPATALAGNWEWWGYRTDSYQTWALATQKPDFAKRTLPYFNVAVYVIGTSWRWNAQGARSIGQCTGITWATSPIYTRCSR